MANRIIFFCFLVAGFFTIHACDEIPPQVQLSKYECTNPPATQQPRRVMIEEYTGVQCVNCPEGSAAIEALQAQHGDKLVAVSIHTGFYSVPFGNSPQDFTFALGPDLNNMLGQVQGYPAGMVNRKQFAGESSRILLQQKWAAKIQQELNEDALAGVEITNVFFDAVTRQLTFDVTVNCYNDIKFDLALTAAITENNIVAPQETSAGVNDTYNHKHVLRAILPDLDGEPIAALPFTQSFTTTLDPLWVENNCHIVAYLHYTSADAGNLNVIQVAEAEL